MLEGRQAKLINLIRMIDELDRYEALVLLHSADLNRF